MQKVLICSPSPNTTGGISSWTKSIFSYHSMIEKNDIDLILLPMERKSFINPHTNIFVRITLGIIDYFTIIKNYWDIIKITCPKVVHISSSASFGLIRDYIMLLIAKHFQIKVIIHFHFGRIPELFKSKNLEWQFIKLIIQNANIVIVLDNSSYNSLMETGLNKVKIIPNPLPPELKEIITNNKTIKRIERKIVFIGHILESKGIFELINACISIPNIKLSILGAKQNGIEEKIREMEIKKNNNHWIDIFDEQPKEIVVQEMLSASVFVLPSYTEGFPYVILESMACGCSIVATEVGAIPEMLNIGTDNIAGICVPPKNSEALREAITRMLNDRKFAERCSENARNRVDKEYNISIIYEQFRFIWNSI